MKKFLENAKEFLALMFTMLCGIVLLRISFKDIDLDSMKFFVEFFIGLFALIMPMGIIASAAHDAFNASKEEEE